jgi:nucleoside-diphosphate-sugar epimerase
MKIFLTGATGLVGAHTALALLQAGHQLRLLVRNKQAAIDYFSQQGYMLDDFVVSDMLDKETVKKHMQGCDAVVHAAAIVDLDARNAEKTLRVNLQSIDSIIGSACELNIPKILYVSSMSAFYMPGAKEVNEESPLVDVNDAYTKSKKICEEKVRELQAKGHPIISTYPSSVVGPYDPKMSESTSAIIKFINLMVPITSSGMQYIDVRDLGRAHALLLDKPLEDNKEQERYMISGVFMPWRDFANTLDKAHGRSVRRVYVPGAVFRGIGFVFDAFRLLVPISFPLSIEATKMITQLPSANSSKLLKTLDFEYRQPHETFSDTIDWLKEKNHIKR